MSDPVVLVVVVLGCFECENLRKMVGVVGAVPRLRDSAAREAMVE
jgi:hypothetical protein